MFPKRFVSGLQEVLDVEDVCQANAPCQRFSECCLSGLCERNARQKLEQTARWQARGGRESYLFAYILIKEMY